MTDTPSGTCACHGDETRAQHDPGYRRALTIVVALNLGFGLCELVGGFIAGSQALKADSLDFIGDGSISLLGLLALAWSARARAKVALTQGLFLGALGLGVIGFAIWRAFHATLPEAELMGAIGVVALAVNVGAALVLSPLPRGRRQCACHMAVQPQRRARQRRGDHRSGACCLDGASLARPWRRGRDCASVPPFGF